MRACSFAQVLGEGKPIKTMTKRWFGCLAIGLLSAAPPLSPAMAVEWTVSRVSGQVWITAPNAPAVRAAAGTVIPDGARFSTMKNARAQLERGGETISASPDTTLTPSESFWGYTTIFQQTGQIELEVETRRVRNVTVETPFLAAVAQGTRFMVTVHDRTADVQVTRGVVEVSDLRSGKRANIRPGQKATVTLAEEHGLEVTGGGQASEVQRGTPRTPQVKTVSTPLGISPAVTASIRQRSGVSARAEEPRERPVAKPAAATATPRERKRSRQRFGPGRQGQRWKRGGKQQRQ